MGQGSSQPTDGAHFVQNGEAHDINVQVANSQPKSPDIIAPPTGESRKNHETVRKRKRKSSNVNSQPKSPEAANRQNEESQTTQERNPKLNREPSDVDFNMARPSINQSPLTKRKKLVDSLESKLPSQPNGSTNPRPSKSQNNPSTRPESQGSKSEPRTPKKVVQRVASHKGSPSVSASIRGSLARQTPDKSNRSGATGVFQPEEVKALEKFKVEFCNTNNCSLATFDQMVQHGKQGSFPGERWIGKRPFWKSAFEVLPDRDRRSVLRFMKRHFQGSDQKSHVWTEEQEAELVALIRQHGTQYARIADMLGRSYDDVVQRWKNRLEHQDKMKIGVWSEDELDALRSALTIAWNKSKEHGYDVGEDIYEMDESLISWGEVSKKMGHVRSRQQCADKWRRIKTKRNNSQPNSRSGTPATPRQSSRRPSRGPSRFRSSQFVEDSDGDDSDGQDDDAASQEKGSTSVQSRKKSPIKKKHTPRKEASSSESQSGSGSEAASEPKDDSEGDSSSSFESESEKEQTTGKKSKLTAAKSDTNPKDKTLSSKKPETDSRSGSESGGNNGDETTDDESDNSSSKGDSDSADESESDNENESDASSTRRATKDADTIKRKRESPIQDDEAQNEKPAKIIKQEFSPTMSEDEEGGQQSDSDAESGPGFKVQNYEPSWFVSSKAKY
ncbi:hypothetical protein ASPCAL04047 [Aspergillus calidoustus]|uniref:MYB DNA-binding domain protein n=1 Tax=Aspergillus calidoustus TaxID=454130 RepID=A0A0U5GQ24_ASPCI|nr:hypothetical protein ASPCAL04047 [Aspergillus calidoustus]